MSDTTVTSGTSTLRVLAEWANMYADWEEGKQCSPSSSDLVDAYERIIGELAVDPRDAFYPLGCESATLEQQLDFLANCEHVQPIRPKQ